MIIKTLGIKSSNSYGRLISYINRADAALLDKDGNVYTIKHNTFGTQAQIEQQYKDNEAGRLHVRSNNNKLLHTILSLSAQDREYVTSEMLEHLSREYIRLLDPDALYYGTIHMGDEGKSPHAHILASAVNMMGLSTRQNIEEFEKLKTDLERISQERYPELIHSPVEHGGHVQSKSDKEWQMEHEGRVSDKQRVQELVSASFELAATREEFYGLLKEDGLNVYERGGQVKGIESEERNYRFATMGIDMKELDKREERYSELQGVAVVQEIELDEEKIEGGLDIEQQRLDELENL